ncbi:MAG: ABC transporter permease, partial [Halobacteriaceae archaeon]
MSEDQPGDIGEDESEEPSRTWRDRSYRAVEHLVGASRLERALISVVALVIAIIVGIVFVFLSGGVASCTSAAVLNVDLIGLSVPLQVFGVHFCYDPIAVFWILASGSLSDAFGIALTLQATTMLLLTGLSVAVSFRAGLFNIGTQGQMVLGALTTGVVGLWLVEFVSAGFVGTTIVLGGTILAAAFVGGIYGAIPGMLKAYADANEVITTIIASGLAATYVKDVMGFSSGQTPPLPNWATFKPIIAPEGSKFAFPVFLGAMGFVILLYYILNYSSFGYNLRISGLQPDAAEYSGVNSNRVIISTMTLSGIFGGLAGAAYI